jgi:hypothetical protein
MQGQSVPILGINFERTWFLVEHPQSFRYPCWVSNGSAVQVEGDLSCVQAVSVPNKPQLEAAQSQMEPSQLETILSPSLLLVDYCSLYPDLCTSVVPALSCPSGYYWDSSQGCIPTCGPDYYWNPDTNSCQPIIK